MWKELLKEGFGDDDDELIRFNWEIREIVWKHFYLWVLDLFFIPFALVVLLTGVRATRMLQRTSDAAEESNKTQVQKDNKRRWVCIKEFLWLMLDIPTAAVALAVCFTPTRGPLLVRRLWHLIGCKENTKHDIGGQNEVIWNAYTLSWKYLFGFIFIDVPTLAIAPFALLTHRMAFFLTDMKHFTFLKESTTTRTLGRVKDWRQENDGWWDQCKLSIWFQFAAFIVDVLALVFFLATLCTWRNVRLVLRLINSDELVLDERRNKKLETRYVRHPLPLHATRSYKDQGRYVLQATRWCVLLHCTGLDLPAVLPVAEYLRGVHAGTPIRVSFACGSRVWPSGANKASRGSAPGSVQEVRAPRPRAGYACCAGVPRHEPLPMAPL